MAVQEDNEPRLRIGSVDDRSVFRPGEQHPGNLYRAERLLRIAGKRTCGAHHNGGFDARIAGVLAHLKRLATDRLRRRRAE